MSDGKRDLPDSVDPAGHQDILALLTATIQRYRLIFGQEAALRIARRVPNLALDVEGKVLALNAADPLSTLSRLVSEFETAAGFWAQPSALEGASSGQSVTNPLPVRVMVVDDHVLFRSGLNSVIAPQPDFVVVGQAESVRTAVAMAATLLPDIILMDFSLPDGTGVDATRAILDTHAAIKIVFLTIHEDDDRLRTAVRAGAMGYLPKSIRTAELLGHLRAVARGEPALSAAFAMRLMKDLRSAPPNPELAVALTPREMELVGELSRGATNREIAAKFVISENTVKNHVRNVLAKLHVTSRRDVAVYARAHGLPYVSPAKNGH
jgi:two-component system nitrate/nitrite response regulator NarL